MIVSDTRRFVFIHNPKCAGTTVRRALMEFDTTGDFFWMFHEADGRQTDKAHMPMAVLKELFPDYFARLETHFVFMLVRDPYSRAISAFNEARWRFQPDADPAEELRNDREAYATALNAFICSLDREQLGGWGLGYTHFIRQRDMAYLGHKLMADCIIKVEELEQASAKLDVFDTEIRARVLAAPHQNVRGFQVEPASVLSREAVAILNDIYRDDFRLFDYPML